MSRSRRVWHLLSNRWNSAITEYALSSARALLGRGHETLFSPLAGSPAEERAQKYFKCESFNKFAVTEVGRAFDLATDFAPEVIVTYGGPETFIASLVARGRDVKVLRFRGQAIDTSGLAAGLKHKLSHRFVDQIVTPSAQLSDNIRELDAAAQVVCVPLGIDVDHFQRTATSASPRPTLVILGRLDPVKGHHAALRILAEMLKTWPANEPRPRLHVVGQPANLSAAHLEGWAKDLGLTVGDDVVITSQRVSNVAELLSNAALGWVSSIGSEIICRVAEEFLACGTPVAVSGVGSLEEVLFDGAGFSYAGKNEVETARLFANWIRKSVAEDLAAKRKRAETARQLYSFETMGEALEQLF